jgi:ribonuclease P protein component
VSNRFPKKARLLKRSDFLSMKGSSRRIVGKTLCLDLRPSSKGLSRLGITASGKYGSSCERNRFKRLVREAFRTHQTEWDPTDIHIVPRQRAKSAKLSDILSDFKALRTVQLAVK